MSKWKVTIPPGVGCAHMTVVEAKGIEITSTGALAFISAQVLVRAFAPGQWLEVELIEEGTHNGYL